MYSQYLGSSLDLVTGLYTLNSLTAVLCIFGTFPRLKTITFTTGSSQFSLQMIVSWFQKLTACWPELNCSEAIPKWPPADCQAWFMGSQKISQKWCLTTVRHDFWDRQAWFLESSGMIYGIVRHNFWDLTLIFRVQKEAKTGRQGMVLRYFKI